MSDDRFQNLPIWLFGGITLAGCALIAATKLAGIPPLLSMFIPVVLMVSYWVISSRTTRIRLHDEQTGDNLYYMGFLFTLTSLGVSLYQFTSESSTDDVVRNFGVAITSTIVGIAMRIMYNQARRDVLDIERNTRQDLASMTRLVRAEMESTRREFADFRRINNQMIAEGFNEIIEVSSETSKKINLSLEKMAQDAMKPVQDAGESFSGSIVATMTKMSSELAELSRGLDTSLEKMQSAATKYEAVKLPDDIIRNELVPMVKTMVKTCADLAARGDTLNREQSLQIRGLADGVGKLIEQSGKTMGHLERSVQATAAVIQRMDASRAVNRPLQVVVPPSVSNLATRSVTYPGSGAATGGAVQSVQASPTTAPQYIRLPEAPPTAARSQAGAPSAEATKSTQPLPDQIDGGDGKWTSWYTK